MGAFYAALFWAAVAIAFELWGPKLADATGWKWPRSKWRSLIGSGLVYLILVSITAVVVGIAYIIMAI